MERKLSNRFEQMYQTPKSHRKPVKPKHLTLESPKKTTLLWPSSPAKLSGAERIVSTYR